MEHKNTSNDTPRVNPTKRSTPVVDDTGITFESPKKQTLDKEVDSLLTNQDDVFDVSNAFQKNTEIGSIVTDKKSKKKSFGGAVASALTEWAGNTKEKADETFSKKETFVQVSSADSRKETINKAAHGATQAPKDDHKVVIQKVRTMADDMERITGTPYLVKEKTKKQASWTHSTAPEKEGEVVEKKVVPRTKVLRENVTPTNTETLVAPQVDERSELAATKIPNPSPEKVLEVEQEHLVAEEKTNTVVIPDETPRSTTATDSENLNTTKSGWSFFTNKKHVTQRVLVEEAEKKELDPTPAPIPQTTPNEFHSEQPKVTEELPTNPKRETRSEPKHTHRYKILISILLLCGIAGIISGVLLYTQSNTVFNSEDTQILEPKKTYKNAVLFSPNREVLLSSITKAIKNADVGVATIQIVNTTQEENGLTTERLVTTNEIFDVLTVRAPATFIRSLKSEVRIGSITTERNTPFIILQSDSFDTAFAGMIDWEPFISADLAPLFGPVVSRTYNINSRLQDSTTEAHFADTVIQNNGVRVLRDETNTERMAYTFLNPTTILLTANTSALKSLLSTVR